MSPTYEPPAILKCLRSIRPNGGLVGMIDVFVIKKYGLLECNSAFIRRGRKIYIEQEEESGGNRFNQQQHQIAGIKKGELDPESLQ